MISNQIRNEREREREAPRQRLEGMHSRDDLKNEGPNLLFILQSPPSEVSKTEWRIYWDHPLASLADGLRS